MLVDIDCDIYEGTVEALSWLAKRGLLVPGTVIYYDDWQVEGEGESKAHWEVSATFGIKWKQLITGSHCDGCGHGLRYLWQVVSIGSISDARDMTGTSAQRKSYLNNVLGVNEIHMSNNQQKYERDHQERLAKEPPVLAEM